MNEQKRDSDAPAPPADAPPPASAKKPYSKPVLRSLGSVNKITLASGAPGHRNKPHG